MVDAAADECNCHHHRSFYSRFSKYKSGIDEPGEEFEERIKFLMSDFLMSDFFQVGEFFEMGVS